MAKTTKRDGGRGRPRHERTDRRSGPVHRTPPPESTGFEERYLTGRAAAGTPIRVRLTDGESFEGPIREFDRDTIEIEHSGRRIRLRKSMIRYIEET